MITLILMILSGMFNACMDMLKTHYSVSIFSNWKNQNWVDPSLSWVNKWKPESKFGDLIMSTLLVFVTDMWHMCKFLMLLSIMFAIVFYQPIFVWWADILIFYVAFSGAFELFYSKLLLKI
jgi:hypothetical protein